MTSSTGGEGGESGEGGEGGEEGEGGEGGKGGEGGYHSGALVATPVHAAVGVQRCGQALRPKGNL